jgi:uncharacterized protein (DUF433 family)
MWTTLQPWQLAQLARLSKTDAERVETILNTLWRSYPGLLGDLAVAAVDQEQLTVGACSDLLQVTVPEVEDRLLRFRKNCKSPEYERAVVMDSSSSVALLPESRIAVWEIVREYRKLGSVERLTEAFPSLPKSELAAALVYAEQNPSEIESQISRYEEILTRKRAEYPFMR